MYKATAGVILPTSIIGSLPRPSWYTAGLGSQCFLEAMMNLRYREQYEDAVSVFLRAQETAGLDICTDGDAHFDEQISGAVNMAVAADEKAATYATDLKGRAIAVAGAGAPRANNQNGNGNGFALQVFGRSIRESNCVAFSFGAIAPSIEDDERDWSRARCACHYISNVIPPRREALRRQWRSSDPSRNPVWTRGDGRTALAKAIVVAERGRISAAPIPGSCSSSGSA